MAILHPQECYFLEQFISLQHYAATRDAIIAFIEAHEEAYERFLNQIPLDNRSNPQWQQPDIVWGNRILPNIRGYRNSYIKAHLYRVNDDVRAFKFGHAMRAYNRNIVEFWDGWMTKQEQAKISQACNIATVLDERLGVTAMVGWDEGALTYKGQGGLYQVSELPKRIPRYVLDPNVRIEAGEINPPQAGIYLPDVENAPAEFLYINSLREEQQDPLKTRQGLKRSGGGYYRWVESQLIETGWTLIRRVEGEFIDVPTQGFFPQGIPEELHSWPEREHEYITRERMPISAFSGDIAGFSGRWGVFTGTEFKHVQVKAGDYLPQLPIKNRYGEERPERVCWTLEVRDDGGSVVQEFESNTNQYSTAFAPVSTPFTPKQAREAEKMLPALKERIAKQQQNSATPPEEEKAKPFWQRWLK